MRSRSRASVSSGHVPLERDAANDPVSETHGARHDTVGAVGPDDDVCADAGGAEPDRHSGLVFRDPADGHALSQLGTCLGSLGREERVQPPPLRHPDQRLVVTPREARPVPEAQLEPVDVALDDGRRVDRDLPQRATRKPTAARLVAREACLVDESTRAPRASEVDGGRGAGGTGSGDEDVEALHDRIVRRPAPVTLVATRLQSPLRRGSRVAKGGGL